MKLNSGLSLTALIAILTACGQEEHSSRRTSSGDAVAAKKTEEGEQTKPETSTESFLIPLCLLELVGTSLEGQLQALNSVDGRCPEGYRIATQKEVETMADTQTETKPTEAQEEPKLSKDYCPPCGMG